MGLGPGQLAMKGPLELPVGPIFTAGPVFDKNNLFDYYFVVV